MAMNRASTLWPVGSINGRSGAQSQARMGQSGTLPMTRGRCRKFATNAALSGTVSGLKTLGRTAASPSSPRTGGASHNCSLNRSNWLGV